MNNKLKWIPQLPNHNNALSIQFTIEECSQMLALLRNIKREPLKDSEKILYDNLVQGFSTQLETWKRAISYLMPPPPAPLVAPKADDKYSDLIDWKLLQQSQRVTVQYETDNNVKYVKIIKNRTTS